MPDLIPMTLHIVRDDDAGTESVRLDGHPPVTLDAAGRREFMAFLYDPDPNVSRTAAAVAWQLRRLDCGGAAAEGAG